MPVDTDSAAEIRGLRTVLRDLVALSAIPAALAGREPPAVAAGLADVLIELLQLEFVFVRLCAPNAGDVAEAMRGTAWETFPAWLESHRAKSSRIEVIPDIGGALGPSRGLTIPIGVNAEGGIVIAACGRMDFPTDIDRILLGLAANHSATAFQNATLIHERARAEEELRKARDVLETTVAERTAELRRSEAYLSEAQRLTHTGTAALHGVTGEVTHSSDEHSRLYGFDPGQGIPTFEEFRQRVHPEDRARWTEAIKGGINQAASVDGEFRVVPPGEPVKHLRAIVRPVFTASGELVELMGTVVDVTERRKSQRKLEASRAELAASRARIVTAADETRRQIERDLHDGVQQRLVSLLLAQRQAQAMVPPELSDVLAQLSRLSEGLTGALEELQEISRGIHPAILAQGGLVPALRALARRSAVPVELEAQVETRLPEPVERAAYYIVSEALTNTAKHARASTVRVAVEARDGILRISVHDDGRGGADPTRGSGLIGLTDRVDALAGTIELASPVGAGTTLLVTLPIEAR
ncbi:MAG: PAS domain-containing protein [Trebonia sp.]